MNLLLLARRNVRGNALRSWVVGLCAFLVAGLALGTVLILRGAGSSLRLANQRLGADVVVVPEGTVDKVEGALLMGHTTRVWMPAGNLDKVAAVPGVQAATPQIYLSTLANASCCSVPNMFLIAYDPATDLTVEPWLMDTLGQGLNLGEVVGGTYVFTPEGDENISIYGYLVTLVANLEPTGTGLDQTMFLTMETARDIARLSVTMALEPLEIPEDSISAVMVRVEPGAEPRDVALEIMRQVPGVTPIPSSSLFQSYRKQLGAVRGAVLVTLGVILGLSVLLIGLVFSMAAHERRRELGVLRAMGASRAFVFRTLLAEAGLLALAGAFCGIAFTILVVYLFRSLIMFSLGLPFLLPSLPLLVLQVLAGLAVALAVIALAALPSALRVSRLDPAVAMRE
jgi:putative ABC transport system permease protein